MSYASKRIVLLGAGAIGSAVGELLVRGGANDLTIVDPDRLVVGNLVRHTLTMTSIDKNKASALSARLNACSPHANVLYIASSFPPMLSPERTLLASADVIIDCTAEDGVLHHMETFPWKSAKVFASISISYRARRLYVFTYKGDSFSSATFESLISPWLQKDRQELELAGEELPWEGTGCWDPVFPAAAEDVWLMASAVIKCLESAEDDSPGGAELVVFEQVLSDNTFMGIKRVETGGTTG